MTITIPNYFIENQEPSLIQLEKELFIESISSHPNKVLVRNTMHGLTLISKGTKEVKVAKKCFNIGQLHAIFFAQGNYFCNQNSKEYGAMTLFFDDGFILNFIKKYGIPKSLKTQKIVLIDYAQQTSILQIINSMKNTKEHKTPKQKELLKLKIELLLLEFYNAYPQQMEQFMSHILNTSTQRMKYILEENIDIIDKVSDMHKLMRMSPSHFQKEFYKIFKISPKIWIDHQRMKKAKFLLENSSKNINQIATACGYSTSSWFIVQFKKYCKITPKEHRIKNQYK